MNKSKIQATGLGSTGISVCLRVHFGDSDADSIGGQTGRVVEVYLLTNICSGSVHKLHTHFTKICFQFYLR